MITVSISTGHHDWSKQNLVTVIKGKDNYDIMKCRGCGMVGKRTSLETITLKSSYKIEKINLCPAYVKPTAEESAKFKFTVSNSPWRDKLPEGTEVVAANNPKGGDDSDWYKRKDGKLLFEDESHGCFKLFSNEVDKELI